MADVTKDAPAAEEDEDAFDSEGNFDQLGAKIKNTYSFRFKQHTLSCPPLEEEPLFKKLKKRLI
jgi:hypothetical protein